jgi:P-type Ca2+ transporter type 2C
MNTWFQKHTEDVLLEQNVLLEQGLSDEDVIERRQKFGSNQLQAGKKINPLMLFLSQFKDVLVIILLVAAVVSWGVGQVSSGTKSVTLEEAREICIGVMYSSDEDLLECANSSTQAEEKNSEGAQEALLIFAIVLAIAIIGFFNEYKAEKTVEALKKLVGSKATVRRGGKIIEIDAVDIVPGDIVILEEGVKVPADLRLIQVA